MLVRRSSWHALIALASLALAFFAYPVQVGLTSRPVDGRDSVFVVAHMVMLTTASLLCWPGSDARALPGHFRGAALASSIVLILLLPFGTFVSPAMTFALAMSAAAIVGRWRGTRC